MGPFLRAEHLVSAGRDRTENVAGKIDAALTQLARARRIQRQSLATRHGLSPLQLDILMIVAAGEPPEPSIGVLARELGVTQPTVTAAVIALERKGLVRREQSAQTPRRTLVRLEPSGRRPAQADLPFVEVAGRLEPRLQEAMLEGALTMIAHLVEDGTLSVARTCLTCRFHRRDADGDHHCVLLGVPLARLDLRVDCPEHQPAA